MFLIWGSVHFVTTLSLHLVETVDTTEQCTARSSAPGPKTDSEASSNQKEVTQDLD